MRVAMILDGAEAGKDYAFDSIAYTYRHFYPF